MMFNYGRLIDEAHSLHLRLDHAAYLQALKYAMYPSARPDAANDERLIRLNRILGRSERRILRRIVRKRAIVEGAGS